MPHRIITILPPNTRGADMAAVRESRARYYMSQLNALAQINAEWCMAEWEAGRVPKCCAKCNGTRYNPDLDVSADIELVSSPVLFQRGEGSCGSIAACHTGHKIAEACAGTLDKKYGLTKPISWDEACRRFQVKMRAGPDATRPMLMHAVCDDNGQMLDPTVGMKR